MRWLIGQKWPMVCSDIVHTAGQNIPPYQQTSHLMNRDELDALITNQFPYLTPKLQAAARYILDHPKEVALQSMRSLAANANLQPASMLRLAKELGFDSYDTVRAVYVHWLSSQDASFVQRASQLRQKSSDDGTSGLLAEIFNKELGNLDHALGKENHQAFDAAQRLLKSADRIYVFGIRSLYPAAFYLHYICQTFTDNTKLIAGTAYTYVDDIRRIKENDVLVVFSSDPYTNLSIELVNYAMQRSAKIIAITDSIVAPIAQMADVTIVGTNSGPSLFPSILPAIAIAQTLGALMLANAGEDALGELSGMENQLRGMNVYTKP